MAAADGIGEAVVRTRKAAAMRIRAGSGRARHQSVA